MCVVQDRIDPADQEEDEFRTDKRHGETAGHGRFGSVQDGRHQGSSMVSEVQDGKRLIMGCCCNGNLSGCLPDVEGSIPLHLARGGAETVNRERERTWDAGFMA